jgi:hypothetical protein
MRDIIFLFCTRSIHGLNRAPAISIKPLLPYIAPRLASAVTPQRMDKEAIRTNEPADNHGQRSPNRPRRSHSVFGRGVRLSPGLLLRWL